MNDANVVNGSGNPDTNGVATVRFYVDGHQRSYITGFVGPFAAMAAEVREIGFLLPIDRRERLVGVLEDIDVDSDRRGQGHGRELLRRFLADMIARGAEAVYLSAEPSEDDFDLVGWYERWDFVRLEPDRDDADTVMIGVTATARRPLS